MKWLRLALLSVALCQCSRSSSTAPGFDAATAAPPARPKAPAKLCTAPGDALMSFSVQGTHGALFSESLSVSCSGKLRFETAAPLAGNEVGRYEAQLSADRLSEVRRVATELDAEPERTPSLPPQGADTTVVVHGKPDVRSWALRPDASAAHRNAAALHASLLTDARRSPVAVVAFTALARPLALIATHRGSQPVTFTIDPASLRVRTENKELPAKAQVGFVDATATGLGGLGTRATFDEGARGAMVLEVESEPKTPAISLSGTLWLPGDDPEAPSSRTFRVTTATATAK